MADSPQQVLAFLDDLAARAKPYRAARLRRADALCARRARRSTELEAWDIGWASEKLRVERYAFSEQEVKQYFPETKVLRGMFRVVETLYGIRIAPAQAPVWHPDVRFFDIRDRGGELIGQFYVDLYARPSKRGGAWMDDAITRKRRDGRVQTPVAYLNCNFSAPVGGTPGAVHPRRGHHAVPRVRPRLAPSAHARGAPRRVRHQRRRVGCGRAAQPVHGELLLGVGRACGHDRARGNQAAAAARAVRQDAGREELPERAADRAPARVRAVRHAPASRFRSRGRR